MKVSRILLLLLIVLCSFSMVQAQPAQTWQTGQTTCYNSFGNVIDCTNTGQDGDIQAGVEWPSPRFADNGNGTITDHLTGLIWLKNASCGWTKNWNDALTYCNNLASGSCGLTDDSVAGDWRLPNRKELMSLVDYGNAYPALPNGHPFTSVQSLNYWSATTNAKNTDAAWNVGMYNGGVYAGNGHKSNNYYVWPVRGGQVGPLDHLNISYPNGGESLFKGQDYILTWNSVNVSGNIQIDLYKGGTEPEHMLMQLAAETENDAEYLFNPPDSLTDGNDYLIGISAENGTVWDFSDSFFTISSKPQAKAMPWISLLLLDDNERLITTKWAQSGFYRYYYDLDDSPCIATPYVTSGQPYVVGCTAVAVGQLINYYFQKGYRNNWLEVLLQNRHVYPRFGLLGNIFYKDCIHVGIATKEKYPILINDWIGSDSEAYFLREFLWTVALGLDSHFSDDLTTVGVSLFYIGKFQSYQEKIKTLLIDRFRFNPNITYTGELTRIDAQKDYIINSINKKEPVLVFMSCDAGGHVVLIDAYRITSEGKFEVKINFGWGNNNKENDQWRPTNGAFNAGYLWEKFIIFANTTPINY